ncbi:MAG: nucleoside deaminase [Candidatus Adiutrix sp.]|jgi:tRNA(Arg) A34 adenosine deaminase TadA|nr:nucleoside deaminase [Candidatus Adiutrix sp.]
MIRPNTVSAEQLMREAIRLAYQGIDSGAGGPFGAVIADEGGNILAGAHNEVLKTGDPTSHAEIMAIRALGSYSLPSVTMFATGYPCPMCLAALLWARIPKVYYCNDYTMAKAIGFDDDAFMHTLGEIYQCSPTFSEKSHTSLIAISPLTLPEGKELYDYWLNQPGHKHY